MSRSLVTSDSVNDIQYSDSTFKTWTVGGFRAWDTSGTLSDSTTSFREGRSYPKEIQYESSFAKLGLSVAAMTLTLASLTHLTLF